MIVHVSNQQTALAISSDLVQRIVEQVVQEEDQTCDEVSINFVDTDSICQLHAQFFDDPSPTDCISFPMDEEEEFGYRLLGEVYICPETAIEYARTHLADPYEETTLYLIHGLLHLMGYRDIEEADIELMRQGEQHHINHLKKLDLCLKPVI